ncbi:ABC transporter substrate-binding protein [Cellulomonas hominis]|uniref:ABC transporter substrate-binding protein n=1 Tax=Cellulomonas hominis TaxID=156981 RepID=A0A511FF37_9CELL|nr:ABC transporter substrate-binding protein [Cellulomonas hominis]MBB5471619.1 multiple sugar transport system substrate-binding protein [Cellulomonas hominis]GEL46438.1 ABC transporter substrate-binding protein [Cellulomonas hominis]
MSQTLPTSDRTPHRPGPSRRNFLAGIGALGAAATLAACAGGSPTSSTGGGGATYAGGKVDLAFWNGFTGGDGPVMQDLVDRFNAEHETITVKMTTMEWADYHAKLPAALTSGQGPHVAIQHLDSLPTSAARGLLLPLDDVADELGLTSDDFIRTVWDAGIYGDARYGIPLDVHPLGFFFNTAVLAGAGLDPAAPPMDRAAYEAALDTLLGTGVAGHWMSPHTFTGGQTLQSLIWQFGGDLFDSEGATAAWARDEGVEALSWMVDAVHKGWSARDVGQDADLIALQNGQAAFNWNGIWSINTLDQISGLEWDVRRLPRIGSVDAAWAGSHNFVLTKQRGTSDDQLEAARTFINWVSQQSAAWAVGGQVPARLSARDSADFAALAPQSAIAEQAEDLRFVPSIPGIGDAVGELYTALNEAVLLTKDPATALADAAARADKVLADNRDRYGA